MSRRGIRYFGEQLPILTPEINASTLRIYLSLSRIYLVNKIKKKEKIEAGVVGPNMAPQLGEHPPERSPTLYDPPLRNTALLKCNYTHTYNYAYTCI